MHTDYDSLDPQLAADLRDAGFPFPTTPSAVEYFDAVFGPFPSLPVHVADGGALFDRLTSSQPARIIPLHPRPVVQPDPGYALAARNGGDITEEARERMRRAREEPDPSDPPAP